MKQIFLITALIATSCFISCSDEIENINQNPNSPESVLPNLIFNSATKEMMDNRRNTFGSGRLTLPWMQYWGQNAYADDDRFDYREQVAEDHYTDTYKVGTDLKAIIDFNTDEATRTLAASVGNNENQIAAARIMLAYNFHQATDFFGDIPYYSYGSDDPDFQGLNVDEIFSPVFAPAEKIYADILKELRESADMIVVSEPVFTSGDQIFNGDALKWKKFANSLILRVANRLRNVDPTTANAAIEAALADGVMESNEDNAAQAYDVADATASPIWVDYIGRNDFAVAAPFVKLLKGETGNFGPDARLFEMAAPASVSIEDVKDDSYDRSENYDDYVGIPYAFQLANFLPFTSFSWPSSNILKPDYSEMLMEYAEVQFVISEHNGFTQENYENGVRASMERWGVAAATVDAFVAGLPAATQETVMNQKYVASYMQPHNAWSEYRRTGFPTTLVKVGETVILPQSQVAALGENSVPSYEFIPRIPVNDLPTRLRYPQILQTLNGTNRATAVSKLDDGDTIESKLFWDVN
ncbi:SusD/RagB family nutrient-binding outer membrane lipoprotein [Pricia sp.]|uniref:SusD/RagB family nutrient-binding outer membrane lipoprotein n=1 Tax=Pricia sp. TaxID=2268138 RepID=UPI0035943186